MKAQTQYFVGEVNTIYIPFFRQLTRVFRFPKKKHYTPLEIRFVATITVFLFLCMYKCVG